MTGRTIEEIRVGDAAEATRAITAATVREFVDATGDDNPLHSDPTFAAATRFGRVIAPGILTGGLISAVIGTRLPGPGTLYISQSFRFLEPVYIGDTITTRVEVTEVLAERNRVCLRTVCRNQTGEAVLEGEAWVMPSRTHIEYRPADERPAEWAAAACFPASLALQAMAFWLEAARAVTGQALARYSESPIASAGRRSSTAPRR
ncbi:MAG: MaoC family dehydratase [Candidatus Rokuibacteriota bacterium]